MSFCRARSTLSTRQIKVIRYIRCFMNRDKFLKAKFIVNKVLVRIQLVYKQFSKPLIALFNPIARFFFNSLHVQSLVMAALSICLVFPDVIFMGASLRLTDQINGHIKHLPLRLFYLQASHRQWWDGYSDNGGAIYQSDPMMEFMLHSLQNGESPYWNPYSSAGSLGPETLIDNKFSVFTLIYATLGGGSIVYNIVLLFLYFWAAYFSYRLAKEKLRVSILAATATTLFYLLNGYAIANIGSNVTQSYLYVPMCLYVSFAFIEKPTALRIVGVALSFAAMFSCTFIPTTITNMMSIYMVLVGHAVMLYRKSEASATNVFGILAMHAVCVFTSILFLGFLYLPIAENISSAGTFEMYTNRQFFPASWLMISSLFSPSHFFESYNAMEPAVIGNINLKYNTNIVYHFGATALGLAVCSVSFRKGERTLLVLACWSLIIAGFIRIFGIPGISFLISKIPIIGNLGSQYWWPVIVIPMLILVAIGTDNLQHQLATRILPFLLLGVLIASLIAVGRAYGIRAPNIGFKEWSIGILIATAVVSTFAILVSSYISYHGSGTIVVAALVLLLFAELTSDSKMMRFERNDFFADYPSEVSFIKENIGSYRTMTISELIGVRPELGSAFGIQEVTSLNQATLPNYMNYFHNAITLDKSQRFNYSYYPSLRLVRDTPDINTINWPAIDLLGVKYIIAPLSFVSYRQEFIDHGLIPVFDADVSVYQNPNALPRAFAIDMDCVVETEGVNLPSDVHLNLKRAKIIVYRNTEVRLKGKVDSPSLVVLTDNWHENWKATVNDVEVPIVLVNGTFRGVQVPSGKYEIHMSYQPRTLKAGILCTGLIILVLIYILFDYRKINSLLNRRLPGLYD